MAEQEEEDSQEKAGWRERWRGSCSGKCVAAFILKNFLPLGFALCIVWMLVWPWPGQKIEAWRVKGYSIVETLMIIIIFFISGLVLKTQEILHAIRHPGPLIYGIVAVLGITPCLGFACIRLPLSPQEFAIGLAVFAIGPCTLAQGQTLVAQAGGNTALALMLLVVTNILAVFISPFLVQAILSTRFQAGGISLQPGKLLINLVVTILSPALLGKARPPALIHPSLPSAALAVRDAIPPLARWVSGHRVTMSLLNNGSLLVIVWIQLCSAHDRLVQQPFQDIVLIILAAVLLHFVFVAINWPMILLLRFPPREAVAALIMSSQKTMPFAVSIIALLPASLGSKGLLTLPPLIGQVSQLFCDVWISAYFGRKIAAENKAKAAAESLPTTAKPGAGGAPAGAPALAEGKANGAAPPLQRAPQPDQAPHVPPGGAAEAGGAAALAQRRPSLRQGMLQRMSSSAASRPDVLRRVSSSARSGSAGGGGHDVEAAYCADAGSIEEPPSEIRRESSLASLEGGAAAASPRSPVRSRRKLQT